MTTTHTPGPWVAVDRDHLGIDDNIIGPNNEQIARVYSTDTDSGIANWNLIAAAPAMLEALELLLPAAEGHVPMLNDWAAKVIRAAIAAAKGGAQ